MDERIGRRGGGGGYEGAGDLMEDFGACMNWC